MYKATSMVSAVALAATSLPSVAEDQRTGFTLGLGAGFTSDPYLGDNDTASVVPILRYQGEGFSVGTNGLAVDLIKRQGISVEGLISPRFSVLDDPDAIELAGIDRDFTVDAGLRLSYGITETLDVSATFLQEVTGEHDGRQLDVGLENKFRLGSYPLAIGAGVSWKSDDLSDYLYGVRAFEATPLRPAYAADASFTPYLSVSTGIPLSSNLLLIGQVRAEFFDDEITDSPIIEDDAAIGGFVGLAYRF